MKKLKAVTLIEITLAIALIGFITGVAYPAYTQYAKKNVLTDGILAASRAKSEISRVYTEELELTNATGSFDFKKGSVSWTAGVITITYQIPGSTPAECSIASSTANTCAQLVITGSIVNDALVWNCSNTGTNPLPADDVPSNC